MICQNVPFFCESKRPNYIFTIFNETRDSKYCLLHTDQNAPKSKCLKSRRPKVKTSQVKMSQSQNVRSQSIPESKPPKVKTPQVKMFQSQNIPKSKHLKVKTSHSPNVPQSKCPTVQMSQVKTSPFVCLSVCKQHYSHSYQRLQ